MGKKHHINTDTFQFFEYTQTAHWLKTKANETGHWNSSIFWTFGTSLYKGARLWLWLVKALNIWLFIWKSVSPFRSLLTWGGGLDYTVLLIIEHALQIIANTQIISFFYRLPTIFVNCTLAMIILGCLTCQGVQFLLQGNNNVFS